jgi:lysophospholipase L1-like esterase
VSARVYLALALAALACAAAAGCGGDDGGRTGRQASDPATPAPGPFSPTPSDAPVPRPGAPVIAALGDSVSAGRPLWDPDPMARDRLRDALNPQSQYEYWAQARLSGRVRFRNCGVSGETVAQIARRLPDCTKGASAVIVQGGTNDVARHHPVRVPAAGLRAIVRRAKAHGLVVVIAQVTPWTKGSPRVVNAIRSLNARIAAIGRDERVRVLPFHDALDDPRRPGRMRPDLTIDGYHPDVPGYRMLGELVASSPPIKALARLRAPRG